MTNTVQFSVTSNRATICLNRPERHNSLGLTELTLFGEYLDEIAADENIRLLVVTSTGSKTFCAGMAIEQIPEGGWKGKEGSPFAVLADQLEEASIPTICALNGSVFGGGGELAMACDFRIGVTGMRMFVPPARLGIHYPLNGMRRYVERVGLSVAKRIFLSCEEFSDQQLLDIDFLDYLVPPNRIEDETDILASRIENLAPLAIRSMKQTLNQIARGTLDEKATNQAIRECAQSEDHAEAKAAFAEKRTPAFKGR